jgi:sugar transferase (PEP-CTERM/EpsH1 system associated)
MSEILFLAHRIPYPPNKGDKIRSWHLLKGLASQFTVHLGTFIDDPEDWQYVDDLRRVCGEICVRPLDPRLARLRGLRALTKGRALTLDYYRDALLEQWIRSLAQRRALSGAFVFSSSMAQYAEHLQAKDGAFRVLDLCDVDSDKWRQYASSRAGVMRWVYAREARLLAEAERAYVRVFDSTLVIADIEAQILRQLAPESVGKIRVLPNGVDTDYFDPSLAWPNPFPKGSRPVVFTGAMDYHPNIDGVRWFVEEIFPAVRTRVPDAHFWVVGSNPSTEVLSLGKRAGISVTGRVADVRPYLDHAAAVVAPLRIARGVQNKVLEGLAMARPIVATANAVQGIHGAGESGLAIVSGPEEFAVAVIGILQGEVTREVPLARRFVMEQFAWDARLAALCDLMAGKARREDACSPSAFAAYTSLRGL